MYIELFLKNKYLFNQYKTILKENQLVIFFDLSLIDAVSLQKINNVLKNKEFFSKKIKNSLFKALLEDSFKNLITGPVLIIYKDKINLKTDFKVLGQLYKSNFILCCLFEKFLYSSEVLKRFNKVSSQEILYLKILFLIQNTLSFKLNNTVKQLVVKS